LLSRDNDLTFHDMTDLVRASGIRGYREVMRGLGADPNTWLSRFHIAPLSLENDDALLDTEAVDHLLEASSDEVACGGLGLRIAQHHDISILGPLGIVLQNASSVREALEIASRFLFVHSTELGLNIIERSVLIENACEVAVEIRRPGRAPAGRQVFDLCLGAMHRIAQLLTGPSYQLKAVTLPHSPVAPLVEYRRFFGVSVIANQERAALHIGIAVMQMQMSGANPALKQITEDYLSRNFRAPGKSVSSRVRLALRRILSTPNANKDDVAAMLAMHPRTLHRRLTAEGSSFENIRDEIRKELALKYLRDTRVSLGQLAGILGFAHQAALTRACQRWFAKTPLQIRATRSELFVPDS
jgi:AraC-like DNA-binding protein